MQELIVMGLTAYLVELVKPIFGKRFVPGFVFLFAGVFSVLASFIFGDMFILQEAIREAVVLGAMTSGIYGLGKSVKESMTGSIVP